MSRPRSDLLVRPRRLGFTLIEMLVVIGIMMLLMGLTIGAVTHTPKVNALVATEHMVSDLIRQARHTARSSGAPVLIEISKADREIMGVSQITLYNDDFEAKPPALAVRTLAMDPQLSVSNGLTGRGLQVGPFIESDAALKAFTTPTQLQKNLQLSRNSGGRVEGFYLACAVNATGVADRIPLVQVGSETDSGATCGIALRKITRQIQQVPGATVTVAPNPPTTLPDQKAEMTCLDPFGWVQDDSGVVTYISADIDAPSGAQPKIDAYSTVSENDVTGPMVPGTWQEIGLLCDGNHLELYRNGVLVGLKNVTVSKLKSADNIVYLGQGLFTDPLTPPPPATKVYVVGTLDDVRLQRLGVDRAALLPSGMEPALDYFISVRPDGRVIAPPAAPLVFNSLSGTERVEITIDSDGTVTSTTVTP